MKNRYIFIPIIAIMIVIFGLILLINKYPKNANAKGRTSNPSLFSTMTTFGNPGFEVNGVTINGVTQTSPAYISDTNNSYGNTLVTHEHSTASQNIFLMVKANTDTSSHGNVTLGQSISSIRAAGWASSTYQLITSIDSLVDVAGTWSATSTPGRLSFKTTPNAATSTIERLVIDSSGRVGIGTSTPDENLTVNGKISSNGTAPALTSCGTSPAINGTDTKGEVTEGTVATGCTITFSSTYTTIPSCVLSAQSGLVFSYTVSATAITITNVGALSSTKLNYICIR